jgi:hypothetical protein
MERLMTKPFVIIAGAALFAGSALAQDPPSFPSSVPGKMHPPPVPVEQQIKEKNAERMQTKDVGMPADRQDKAGETKQPKGK